MKSTGITRPIDTLGRVVIPKELRDSMNWNEGDRMDFAVEGDRIIIKKYVSGCHCCNNEEVVAEVLGIKLCSQCIEDFNKARKIIDTKLRK